MKKKQWSAERWQREMLDLIAGGKPTLDGIATLEQGLRQLTFQTSALIKRPQEVRLILEVAMALRQSKHRRRTQAERELLSWLDRLVTFAVHEGYEVAPLAECKLQVSSACRQVLESVADFAAGCFVAAGKSDRWRDERAAWAYEVFLQIMDMWEVPAVVTLAHEEVARVDSKAAGQAAKLLGQHYVDLDQDMAEDLVQKLLNLSEQTDDESVVFAALSALESAGMISDFEALHRLDDWRDARDHA